jgi:very-short-patch-repair endonuclease
MGRALLKQVNVDYVGPDIDKKCRDEAQVASDEAFGTISAFIAQCESPIEKQLAVALFFADWKIENCQVAYAPTHYGRLFPCLMGKGWDHAAFEPPIGLCQTVIISPQQVIGSYRADLLVVFIDQFTASNQKPIFAVIECDGKEFHAATEEQIARDKKRDREMQAMGYNVFRFTGSEIFKDADKCADDVVRFCTSLRDARAAK